MGISLYYYRLLKKQWGTGYGRQYKAFPLAYPNYCAVVNTIGYGYPNTNPYKYACVIKSQNQFGFTPHMDDLDSLITWFSLGY